MKVQKRRGGRRGKPLCSSCRVGCPSEEWCTTRENFHLGAAAVGIGEHSLPREVREIVEAEEAKMDVYWWPV